MGGPTSREAWRPVTEALLAPGAPAPLVETALDIVAAVPQLTRSGEIAWEYGDGDEHRFYTQARGSSQRLPNGNTLIAVSNRGEAREVTPEGDVVWQFYSGRRDEESRREVIIRMHHYPPERIAPLIARSGV